MRNFDWQGSSDSLASAARLMQAVYPPELTWHIPLNLNTMRSDVWAHSTGLFRDADKTMGSCARPAAHGVLVWRPQTSRADQLWVAAALNKKMSPSWHYWLI